MLASDFSLGKLISICSPLRGSRGKEYLGKQHNTIINMVCTSPIIINAFEVITVHFHSYTANLIHSVKEVRGKATEATEKIEAQSLAEENGS